MGNPTICLNMIVKNESAVITRCPDSVAHLIDYWVISDTGSEDGTQNIIKDYFLEKNIPGILREDEWQDFAHNRNLALQPALDKADYILIMDADDFIECKKDYYLPIRAADSYQLKTTRENIIYYCNKLVKGGLNWRWVGVLHEYLFCESAKPAVNLEGDYLVHSTTDGDRSTNPDKYKNDIRILEKGLQDEPNNDRYQFYLAQSYRDDRNYEQSLIHYQKRVEMGGWYEEVYYSLLEVARNKMRLEYPVQEILDGLMRAHAYRPERLEAMHDAVKLCREKALFNLGYQLASGITETSQPNDVLFVEDEVYAWRLLDEISICAINAGYKEHGGRLLNKVIDTQTFPEAEKDRIQSNLKFAMS